MPTGLAQNLSFILLGEDKSASKSMNAVETTAQKVTGSIGGAFSKMGGVIGGEVGGVLNQVGNGIKDVGESGKAMATGLMVGGAAITAVGIGLQNLASADKQATDQLKASIDATGDSWDDYEKQVADAIATNQNFDHEGEDTTKALSILTLATNDTGKALDQMQLVADLAAQKHISLEKAAGMVAKILGGAGGKTLTQYGITMEENADGTKNVDKALSELGKKLDGQAKASVQNFGSQVDIVKTKIVDWVQEIAGPLGTALTAIGPVLSIVGVGLDVYKNRQIAATVATLAATDATVAETAAQVGLNIAMDANPIGLVAAALGVLAGVVGTGMILSGTQDLTAATADYTATLDANTGAITDNTRAAVTKELLDKGALAAAQKLGIAPSLLVDAVLGEADARTQLTAAMDAELAKRVDVANGLNGNYIAQGALDAQTKELVQAVNTLNTQFVTQSDTLKQNITSNKLFLSGLHETESALDSTERKALSYAEALKAIPSSVSTSVDVISYANQFGAPQAHAAGGIVTKPQMGIVGESGPEAIIPLNAGLQGLGDGGGNTYVTINPQGMVFGTPGEVARQLQTMLINSWKNGGNSKTEFSRAIGVSS